MCIRDRDRRGGVHYLGEDVDEYLAAGRDLLVVEDVPVGAVGGEPDALERVERTVAEVAAGITGQDFEPRPSFEVCSWCDFRLICPASEA